MTHNKKKKKNEIHSFNIANKDVQLFEKSEIDRRVPRFHFQHKSNHRLPFTGVHKKTPCSAERASGLNPDISSTYCRQFRKRKKKMNYWPPSDRKVERKKKMNDDVFSQGFYRDKELTGHHAKSAD